MSKENLKINRNIVGATISRPYFEAITKNNNGITLIALIITIIVMMILVAVSVSVALNGGLFDTAKYAGSQTQLKAEEEMLLSAVVGSINEKAEVDFDKLDENLPQGFTGEDGTYTSSSGNTFIVESNGKIMSSSETIKPDQPLGPNEKWIDNGDETYTKGDKTISRGTIYTTDEVLKELGLTKTEGKYEGNWEIIGVEDGKLKLVSVESVTTTGVTLGYDDLGAIKAIPLGENEELTNEIILERHIWSYIHAIETLNATAKNATGIMSAESITIEDIYDILGEENINKGDEYGKTVRYYSRDSQVRSQTKEAGSEQWSSEYTMISSYNDQIFVDKNGEIVTVNEKGGEITLTDNWYNYSFTGDQKLQLGSLAGNYWLASYETSCRSYNALFHVRFVIEDGISGNTLFISDKTNMKNTETRGVRAIVLI